MFYKNISDRRRPLINTKRRDEYTDKIDSISQKIQECKSNSPEQKALFKEMTLTREKHELYMRLNKLVGENLLADKDKRDKIIRILVKVRDEIFFDTEYMEGLKDDIAGIDNHLINYVGRLRVH
jgi:hypothetical protein